MSELGKFGVRTACAAALAAVAAIAGAGAQAATLVGYFPGNDPFGGDEKGLHGTFNGVAIDSPSLAKCEVSGLSCGWENGAVEGEDYTGAFKVDFTDDRNGTWSFTADPSLTHGPAYLVVKAATNWGLYALDGALSGSWSTAGLMTPNGKNQAGVSHISFYNGASPAPIPLPAAGWLLIAGLAGLGGMARRRRAAAA
jgi:hypothetical protein